MNIIPTLIILGVITAVTGIAECFLAREDWRLGLILPILSVIAAFFFGPAMLILTAVLACILGGAVAAGRRKESKAKELEQMNIQELE